MIGLPNAGKSTLFNALVQTHKAATAPYPFCTIQPNVGTIFVPDQRIIRLAQIIGSETVHPPALEVVDLAGLVQGASRGEGLGNQFLGRIREVDALLHVVRAFPNPDVPHPMGEVDPLRDVQVVETELVLADLELVDRRLERLRKGTPPGGSKDPRLRWEYELLGRVRAHLNRGLPARQLEGSDEQKDFLLGIGLLTMKPQVYCCNVEEKDLPAGSPLTKPLEAFARGRGEGCVILCAKLEEELVMLEAREAREYLEALGLEARGIHQLLQELYRTLGLKTFYTANEKEARAWPFLPGTTAWQAAGRIHSDFQRGFIACECISWKELDSCGSLSRARELGKIRLEGRDYLVADGDILYIRFHV